MAEADLWKLLAVVHELPESIDFFFHGHEFWKLTDRYSNVTEQKRGGICLDIFVIKPSPDGKSYRFLNVHGYRYKELPTEVLFPVSTVEFAGAEVQLPVPAAPAYILEQIYRAWQKLPPEDQRVFPHISNEIEIREHGQEPIYELGYTKP